jgi:hypothetical protein
MYYISRLPFFLQILVTFLFIFLFLLLGMLYGRKYAEGRKDADKDLSTLIGAQLAAVAFIIAFIFSIAASRFEMRRASVIEEVNSIGTTFLRADFFPEPQRTDLRRLLKKYINKYVEANNDLSMLDNNLNETDLILDNIWKIASEYQSAHPEQIAVNSFIQSLNGTIDLHTTRATVLIYFGLGENIWLIVYILTSLAMLVTGFQLGVSSIKIGLPALALAITFTLMISLISDLDSPREGAFQINNKPLIELYNKVDSEVK